ncbi:MAG: HmuY family protein [Pseudomonadota bacterium]|nr:HmuY family protein [Pseudomonadota bacterium]
MHHAHTATTRTPRRRLTVVASLLAAGLVAGCADDLQAPNTESDAPDQPTAELPGPGGEAASFVTNGDFYSAVINATGDDWIYLDLDTQTQVYPENPDASDAWDIALQGSDIKLNGGTSGSPPGGEQVVAYPDKSEAGTPYPWESVVGAPPPTAVEYVTDDSDPITGGFVSDYVLTTLPEADSETNPATGEGDYGWFHYSGFVAGSVVSARSNVAYVIRSVECRYFKLRMTGYTNADDERGHPQFDLLEIPGTACNDDADGVVPLGAASFTPTADGQRGDVDATAEDAWVYINLGNALQVEPVNPGDDATWDLAFKRTDIKLNGGASGTAAAALHDLAGADWTTVVAVPADADWHEDADDALAFVTYPPAENTGTAACGNINGDFGWYYYSGFCDDGDGVHHISPRDVVYVVRDRQGLFFKLRMLSYYDDAGSSAHPSFEFAPLN